MQVREVCERNKTTWQTNAAFSRAAETLKTSVTGINETNTQLQGSDVGVTEDKSGQKKEMAKLAFKISGALLAYGHEQSRHELIADAALSKDDIIKAKDVDADDLALHILKLGNQYHSALGDYGVSQEDIDNLGLAIQSFTTKIGTPRLNQTERKLLREKQEKYFLQADNALQNVMDNLIHQFEGKDELFYEAYQNARSVIRSGAGKAAVAPKQSASVL